MYLPSHFAETRVDVLHAFIRGSGLATLVTAGADGLDASHVPLLVEPSPEPLGRLVGHLARANPQWQAVPEGSDALALFLGPDAYVSPSWYATKRETGEVVPTWNYVAIHAHGRIRFFHDRERLLDVVTRLTDRQERPRTEPWKVTDAPAAYVDATLKGIVGVELTLTRLEGKWKASQNRSQADRQGVAEGLARDGRLELARLVGHVPDLPPAPAAGRRTFSVAIFCRHGGAVLLVHHRRLGTWLPVGGEVEAGETPLEAARRELMEETGLSGRFPGRLGVDGTPPGLLGYEEHPAGSKGLHMNFAFVAEVATRQLRGCDEFDAVRWVGADQLDAVDCPRNVRELARLALAAPAA